MLKSKEEEGLWGRGERILHAGMPSLCSSINWRGADGGECRVFHMDPAFHQLLFLLHGIGLEIVKFLFALNGPGHYAFTVK